MMAEGSVWRARWQRRRVVIRAIGCLFHALVSEQVLFVIHGQSMDRDGVR